MKRLLKLHDIIGDKRRGIPPIIPMSRAQWYLGVSKNLYPRPLKLSEGSRASYWPEDEILALIERRKEV